MTEPLDIDGLPAHVYDSNQWWDHGYAFDGERVIHWFVDRKEQYDGITSRQSVEAFLASDADPASKAWLRALLDEAPRA